MSNSLRLGLGNTIGQDTVIFYGSISTRDAFGRITDLIAVWAKKEHSLNQKLTGDLRVLAQGLLEFASPTDKAGIGHLELAVENQQIFINVRFENFIVVEDDEIEKKLAQYWLNSEESSLIKRILYPQDRVEVRFLKRLNLLEWRIIRSIELESINLETVSFQVFSVSEESLTTEHKNFVEMGDVHYGDWISAVYQNDHEKNKSGEFFDNGESLQGEEEWVRVVSDHDQKVVDDSISVIKAQSVNIELEDIEVIDGQKKSSFISEVEILNEKIKQYRKLLKQKEKQNQKIGIEITTLQKKLSELMRASQGYDGKTIQQFRDKALQMFEMAKGLQLEKQSLEKEIVELKNSIITKVTPEEVEAVTAVAEGKLPDESPGLLIQIEELSKKAERLARALEAEKGKVKGLLDRTLIAEKEAQSSTPLIAELEKKVENTLKMAQQHKKETEHVKQKLVQSEAEKNKIKNDLLKVQAQVQTLMKRQAS